MKNKISSSSPTSRGSCCRFLTITDRVAIKIYNSEWAAEVACRRQNEMHRLGFAPKASRRAFFINCDSYGHEQYGYLTEVAELFVELYRKQPATSESRDILKGWAKEFGYHVMSRTGEYPLDLHIGNIGFLGNRVVLTDFMHPDEVDNEEEGKCYDCNKATSLESDWSDSYPSTESNCSENNSDEPQSDES